MKNYVKPELFYEHYELSTRIAMCAWDLNLADESVCGFKGGQRSDFPGEVIITGDVAGCEITDYEAYCYQANFDDNVNLFNS